MSWRRYVCLRINPQKKQWDKQPWPCEPEASSGNSLFPPEYEKSGYRQNSKSNGIEIGKPRPPFLCMVQVEEIYLVEDISLVWLFLEDHPVTNIDRDIIVDDENFKCCIINPKNVIQDFQIGCDRTSMRLIKLSFLIHPRGWNYLGLTMNLIAECFLLGDWPFLTSRLRMFAV